MADFAYRAITVVGRCFHDDGHTARAIALEGDLLIDCAWKFAGTALDGAFAVVRRHVLRLGGSNRGTQALISVRIAACLGCDSDFFDQTSEDLAAFRVKSPFFVLNCRPF